MIRHYLKMSMRFLVSNFRAKKIRQAINLLSKDQFMNRKAIRDAQLVELPTIVSPQNSTSVSDYADYRQIVEGAATDDHVFETFRSHPQYFPILEHVSRDQGRAYLEIIEKRQNLPVGWAQLCRQLNEVGNPQKHTYPFIGRFSPTLLRYLKVLSDLELLFGPLKGLRYVEIGIGFGGQAAVLDLFGKVDEVHLYDLPPVLALAEKFLSRVSSSASRLLLDGTNPSAARPADLLVSNYAFSELTRAVQLSYLEKVIVKAARGYITWNSLSRDGLNPAELLELIPGSKLLEEQPRTATGNVIIAWGSDQSL